MSSVKFVRHPAFPQVKCFFTASGYFWKMRVREWAFAQVNVENMATNLEATSNNPNVVLGHTVRGEKGIKTTNISTTQATIKFFANARGFTFIYMFDKDPSTAVDGVQMQVEVLERRAASPANISLTKLNGKTVAINAPDAQSYTMDSTLIFSNAAINPLSFFSGVPSGTNHVVISSHGGVPTTADRTDSTKICMFVAGFKLESLRLDVGNVEGVFNTLKGKVAEQCVIWFGGCNIGANTDFCSKAASASGCHVVAPVMPLTAQKFPKNNIDILDGFAMPRVFGPDGKPMNISDFCAKQDLLKFVVPV